MSAESDIKAPLSYGHLAYGHLGSIHLHIDGGDHARKSVDELARKHFHVHDCYEYELAKVERFEKGPQRIEQRRTYEIHTPGRSREELDFFSTTLLNMGPGLPSADRWRQLASDVNNLLVDLYSRDDAGVVVELERVVATVDSVGIVQVVSVDNSEIVTIPKEGDESKSNQKLACLSKNDRAHLLGAVLFAPFDGAADGADYEFHFALDIKRSSSSEEAPFDLKQLVRIASDAKINVGGWFLFDDDKRWAYRSNSFGGKVSVGDLKKKWTDLYNKLMVEEKFKGGTLRLLVEESLAVWKTPPKKKHKDIQTVPELARWEREFENLREFWVAAPNFLGDWNDDVEAAMIENLHLRKVKYVYFLRTNADAKRWLLFKKKLVSENLCMEAKDMQAYVVGFREPDKWKSKMAFIANPNESTRQGMHIDVDSLTKRIKSGSRMTPLQTEDFVRWLNPSMEGGEISQWRPVLERGEPKKIAMVCLRLESRLNGDELDLLDDQLARETSHYNGEIIHYGSRSIIVSFGDELGAVARAVRFANNLATCDKLTEERLKTKLCFGIDYNVALQIFRACGLRWEGAVIRNCRVIVDDVGSKDSNAKVFLTAEAERLYSSANQWPDIKIAKACPGDPRYTEGEDYTGPWKVL